MIQNNIFEVMGPDAIEVRPSFTKDGKTALLLYQDSRNTMDVLDKTFGVFGWQMTYKDVNGQIYGCLSVKDPETGQWITKEDTGSESNIEAQKGMSSDCLKRCAVRFGYGRELYTAPRIMVDDDGYGNTGFKVSEITYDDNRNIKSLIIVNKWGKEAFNWSLQENTHSNSINASNDPKIENEAKLKNFCTNVKNSGQVDIEELKRYYNFYVPKMKDWKGEVKPNVLLERWLATSRNNS